MIKDYAQMGIRSLRRRKLRSWLTMLGIFISIATIFVLISVSFGLQDTIKEQFRQFGADKFIILPKGLITSGVGGTGASQMTMDDVNAIASVSGVKDYSYFTISSAELDFNNEKRFSLVIGIPLDRLKAVQESLNYKAAEGRVLQKGDSGKIMVGNSFFTGSIFSKPVHERNTIVINGVDFKVQATLEPTGNPEHDKYLYIPMDSFRSLFNNTQRVDEIIVQANPGESVKTVAARVEKRLISERGLTKDTEDFTILTPEEILTSFNTILNVMTVFLIGIAAISLIVGGIGIANTMYTSVLERTSEIGVMKAVGARNSDILLIFLIESGMLGLTGGVIGVGLGFAMSKIIEIIANKALGTTILQTTSPLYLFIGCLAFAFIMGAAFGVFPAWRASKIRPVDALRYE